MLEIRLRARPYLNNYDKVNLEIAPRLYNTFLRILGVKTRKVYMLLVQI